MTKLLQLSANTIGTDYVCGDIHGMWDELQAALAEHQFNPELDRLIALGDLVDRGPQSYKCLELIEQPWFHSIMGNHEQLALYSLSTGKEKHTSMWLNNGGHWVFDIEPEDHAKIISLMRKLPLGIDLELEDQSHVGFVHAELPGTSWQAFCQYLNTLAADDFDFYGNQVASTAMWSRSRIQKKKDLSIHDVRHVFHGHTILDTITTLGNRSYIDTGSFKTGNISVLNIKEFLNKLPAQVPEPS